MFGMAETSEGEHLPSRPERRGLIGMGTVVYSMSVSLERAFGSGAVYLRHEISRPAG
jgi:hypothetical protein